MSLFRHKLLFCWLTHCLCVEAAYPGLIAEKLQAEYHVQVPGQGRGARAASVGRIDFHLNDRSVYHGISKWYMWYVELKLACGSAW